MDIDPKAKIFTDVTDDQAMEMLAWAHSVVVDGVLPQPEPAWVELLITALDLHQQPHNRLLFLSTVLPQRILLSVVFHLVKLGTGRR
ncbi:MAG: hypothetical protein E6R03_09400 [Hyphomicrobiaceae bacterium]|nr:MAG: hypothetical protein E6R03_09400 [Hyphomicrobiaceae bacterium]